MKSKLTDRERAQRLIDKRDNRVFDLCAEYSQIFDNVKEMEWLLQAVIDEIL